MNNELNNESIEFLGYSPNNNTKKSKKGLYIILLVILIILFLGIGSFIYIKITFNAEIFLDKSAKNITTFIDNISQNIALDDEIYKNIDKYDIVNNTTLKVNSLSKNLQSLNNLEFISKSNLNIVNNYFDIDLTLKQDDAQLNATATMDNEKIYIESKDLINKVIAINTNENDFINLKDYTTSFNTLKNINIFESSKNLVNYLFEALKEAQLTTKFAGLKVTYTYDINNTNKQIIKDKLQNLIKDNEELSNYVTSDDIYIDNTNIVIDVNILTGNIEKFTITNEDGVINGIKLDDNKFKIIYEDSIIIYQEIKNKYTITLSEDDDRVAFTITNKENSTSNIDILLKFDDDEVNCNLDISTNKTNKTINITGYVNFSYSEYKFKTDITTNTKYGQDLINKKKYSTYTNIQDISQNDQITLYNNLEEKISSFKAYNLILDNDFEEL